MGYEMTQEETDEFLENDAVKGRTKDHAISPWKKDWNKTYDGEYALAQNRLMESSVMIDGVYDNVLPPEEAEPFIRDEIARMMKQDGMPASYPQVTLDTARGKYTFEASFRYLQTDYYDTFGDHGAPLYPDKPYMSAVRGDNREDFVKHRYDGPLFTMDQIGFSEDSVRYEESAPKRIPVPKDGKYSVRSFSANDLVGKPRIIVSHDRENNLRVSVVESATRTKRAPYYAMRPSTAGIQYDPKTKVPSYEDIPVDRGDRYLLTSGDVETRLGRLPWLPEGAVGPWMADGEYIVTGDNPTDHVNPENVGRYFESSMAEIRSKDRMRDSIKAAMSDKDKEFDRMTAGKDGSDFMSMDFDDIEDEIPFV